MSENNLGLKFLHFFLNMTNWQGEKTHEVIFKKLFNLDCYAAIQNIFGLWLLKNTGSIAGIPEMKVYEGTVHSLW